MAEQTCCCACIQTGSMGVVERFGRFDRLAPAGVQIVCWPMDVVAGLTSLRVQQLDLSTESKTSDDVTVIVKTAIQYQVIPTKAYDAYYSLTDVQIQVRAYVDNEVRSVLPKLSLDEAFESKDQISQEIKHHLTDILNSYGYQVMQALVVDMIPNASVRDAMNQINTNRRLKEAAAEKAEGNKTIAIKNAEAAAEAKYLSGEGVARQRQAIIDGFKTSVLDFSGNVEGTTPRDIMNMMMTTQYLDMLKDVGEHKTNTKKYMPHSKNPSVTTRVRDGIMAAGTTQTNRNPKISQLLGMGSQSANAQALRDDRKALRAEQAAAQEVMRKQQEEDRQRQQQQQQMQAQQRQQQQSQRQQQQQQMQQQRMLQMQQQAQQQQMRLMQAQQQGAMMRQQQQMQQQQMQQPQMQQQAQVQQFAVQVPQGCSPGQRLQIQNPFTGQMLMVQIPAGVYPGQQFAVQC